MLGEGGSTQSMATTPERIPTTTAPKKLTPKRKLRIGWTRLDLNYRFARWTHLGSIYACVRWTHLYSAYGFGCELILFSIYEFVWQTYAYTKIYAIASWYLVGLLPVLLSANLFLL